MFAIYVLVSPSTSVSRFSSAYGEIAWTGFFHEGMNGLQLTETHQKDRSGNLSFQSVGHCLSDSTCLPNIDVQSPSSAIDSPPGNPKQQEPLNVVHDELPEWMGFGTRQLNCVVFARLTSRIWTNRVSPNITGNV